jgi:hypothetical protein
MLTERLWSSRMLILASLALVGLGLYFVFIRPPLLPEDERYIGAPARELGGAGPHLAGWLGHVFRVVVGVNFAIASDFRWLLLMLALPWTIALALWAVGR